jgi:hypothetical protein
MDLRVSRGWQPKLCTARQGNPQMTNLAPFRRSHAASLGARDFVTVGLGARQTLCVIVGCVPFSSNAFVASNIQPKDRLYSNIEEWLRYAPSSSRFSIISEAHLHVIGEHCVRPAVSQRKRLVLQHWGHGDPSRRQRDRFHASEPDDS